jgi:hypothetical protein
MAGERSEQYEWVWEDGKQGSGKFKPFDAPLATKLETAAAGGGRTGLVALIKGQPYEFDLQKMQQTNPRTQFVRRIKRRQPADPALFALLAFIALALVALACCPELALLPVMTGIAICMCHHKAVAQDKSGQEFIMYHGTTASAAQAIEAGGFRASTGGMLGPGVYCSRDIRKARAYGGAGNVVLKLKVRSGLRHGGLGHDGGLRARPDPHYRGRPRGVAQDLAGDWII